MAFFFSDNPIALFFALILVVVILKIVLGKHRWFSGKKNSYVLPIVLAAAILLIAYQPLLRIISFGAPFLALLIVFLFAVGAIMFVLGMPKPTIWTAMKETGFIKTATYIAIFCIIAFAISHVYGERLLESPTVSLGDVISPAQEEVKIDFAPLFTKQALGLIMVFVVLGLAFFFVNVQ
jgi:hypothetical protein